MLSEALGIGIQAVSYTHLLGLAFHCFLLQKIENRYATALAGHRAAILFNSSLQKEKNKRIKTENHCL